MAGEEITDRKTLKQKKKKNPPELNYLLIITRTKKWQINFENLV